MNLVKEFNLNKVIPSRDQMPFRDSGISSLPSSERNRRGGLHLVKAYLKRPVTAVYKIVKRGVAIAD